VTEAEFAQLQANQRAAAGEVVPPRASEAEIERDCTAWLELDGWRALRTDPVSDRKRGKGFGELGMADHLYIRYGPDLKLPPEWKKPVDHSHAQVLWIEFKRPGQHPAPHQVAWHQQERARGALTAIAGEDFPATVEGFQIWYRSSGLQRR
jgi:hypothetical protein